MRLYMRPIAPNAVKVFVFMAERGIALEQVDVGDLVPEEFARISPLGAIPVLETDSGLLLSESLTICQYLDAVSDGPSLFGDGLEERMLVAMLFGDGLEERMLVAMWERRGELMLMNPAIEYGHHTQAMFADRMRQFPDWAHAHVEKSKRMIALMEERLESATFLAGEGFTMADLTAFLGYFGLVSYGAIEPLPSPALSRWLREIGARPSMAPMRALAAQFGLKAI
jgi:glutathione S-transferase